MTGRKDNNMSYTKIPLGKLIFSGACRQNAEEVRRIIASAINWDWLGYWSPSAQLWAVIDGEFDANESDPIAIPAGDIVLWAEDYALPAREFLLSAEVRNGLGYLGWSLSPSEALCDAASTVYERVKSARQAAHPPEKGPMGRRGDRA